MTIKNIISLIIVLQWVIATGAILTLMLTDIISITEGIELLKSYSAVTSGFVGIIIGNIYSSNGK